MHPSALWLLSLMFLGLAALVLVAGLILRKRQSADAQSALSTAVKRAAAQPGQPPAEEKPRTRIQQLLARIAAIGRHLEESRIRKALLTPEDLLLLEQAGWGHSTGQAVFLGLRVCLAMLLPLMAIFFLDLSGIRALIVLLGLAAAGVLLPKFILRSWNKRLRKAVHDELPLFIDLLRLLQSVGFSVDQSLQMLGDKLRPALPVIGRELSIANTAYSRGRSREQSLERLSESFANDDLRSLVQMVVQVHSHGGAVQEPLKQFGMRLREKRRMEMKEKIGKLSVKMTVVMMVTLLPALMLVLAGPAIVALGQTVSKMGTSG